MTSFARTLVLSEGGRLSVKQRREWDEMRRGLSELWPPDTSFFRPRVDPNNSRDPAGMPIRTKHGGLLRPTMAPAELQSGEAILSSAKLPPSRSMAPRLAYGRHRGPVGVGTRAAAVAVVLLRDRVARPLGLGPPAKTVAYGVEPDAGSKDASEGAFWTRWRLVLTVRPTSLRHHGGQVCFPGGRIEAGENACDAAKREFEEELGVSIRDLGGEVCGMMDPLFVFASKHLVYPVVMIANRPENPWNPEPGEVADVVTVSLHEASRRIAAGSRHARRINGEAESAEGPSVRVRSFSVDGYHVWGATAMLVADLVHLLGRSRRPSDGSGRRVDGNPNSPGIGR